MKKMKKLNRYVGTYELYHIAENDQDAKKQSVEIEKFLQSLDDNRAKCIELGRKNFAEPYKKIDL